jgi:hypothetical protein
MTDATRARLLDAVARTPSPTRRTARLRSALGYALAASWMILVFVLGHDAAPHSEQPGAWSGQAVFGLFALACAATAWIAARGSSPLGRSSFALALASLVVPVCVLAWLALWSQVQLNQEVPAGWRCLGFSLLMGALPLVAFLGMRRGSDPVHPQWLGAALGALAGAWSAAFVAGWCPLFDWQHALLGHAAPVALLSSLGAAAGSALLGLRHVQLGAKTRNPRRARS